MIVTALVDWLGINVYRPTSHSFLMSQCSLLLQIVVRLGTQRVKYVQVVFKKVRPLDVYGLAFRSQFVHQQVQIIDSSLLFLSDWIVELVFKRFFWRLLYHLTVVAAATVAISLCAMELLYLGTWDHSQPLMLDFSMVETASFLYIFHLDRKLHRMLYPRDIVTTNTREGRKRRRLLIHDRVICHVLLVASYLVDFEL